MRRSFLNLALLVSVCLLLVPDFLRADSVPAVSFTSVPGSSNLNANIGWVFAVPDAVEVTGLGYYDLNADGLAGDHTVGIFNASTNLLVSAVVPSGTGGDLIDGFRYTHISGFELTAGLYFLMANNPGTDAFVATVGGFSVDPRIVYGTGAFALGGDSLAFPTNVSTPFDPSLFGPNMLLGTTVPEPATLLLFGTGLIGFGMVARRRNVKSA